MLNVIDKAQEDKLFPLLRLGFRPFFLLGTSYAVIAICLWLYLYNTGQPNQLLVPRAWWHGHEMLFGFAMAIVAGFLLTAVQNWTGITGTKGKKLALLCTLWLLPRVLFWIPAPSWFIWVIGGIEALFLAMVAYEISIRVIKAKKYRNLIFLPWFIVAILVNFANYAALSGIPPFKTFSVWQATFWWFALLIAILGGRVIPFFTANKIGFSKPEPILALELMANIPLVLLFLFNLFSIQSSLIQSCLLLFAALAQTVRFCRWRFWTTYHVPLVWSLHMTYACLPVYLFLNALAASSLIEGGAWIAHQSIHVLAIGCIAGVILAMISRVTMGHTGHSIYEGPNMSLAFILILMAALLRGIIATFFIESRIIWINISGALFVLAFFIYLYHFGRMLMKPRADGHPG